MTGTELASIDAIIAEVIVEHGVTIDGTINLPATVPYHTSQMYAKNVVTFLLHLQKENAIDGDSEDEIVKDMLVTRGGEVLNGRVRDALGLPAPTTGAAPEASAEESGPVSAEESADESPATEDASPEDAPAKENNAEDKAD